MNRITIYAESLLRSDILGDEFELPETPELCDAMMVINKACSDEVMRRKEQRLDVLASEVWSQLRRAQADGNTDMIREILKNFYKSGRNENRG